MRITIAELRQIGITWSDVCRVTGGNEWAFNEGQLGEDSEVDLSVEQAQEIGILKN